MAKVHPNAAAAVVPASPSTSNRAAEEQPTVLTVWRKSLLFNCEGFTVFDARGDLAFRVDCYGSSSGGIHRHRRRRRRAEDVVLMDAAGKPVLTIRRKRTIILADSWVVYDGDGTSDTGAPAEAKPLLSVHRHAVGLLHRHRGASDGKAVAHVTNLLASTGGAEAPSYVVEGSYGRRSCAVRDARGGGAAVVEGRRKDAVGDDVFRLVVAADATLGAALSMGVAIALDQMFGRGSGSLLPRRWSA